MRSIEWAAGLFEGEGCVSVGRRRGDQFTTEVGRSTVVLALAMTDLDVVEAFVEVIGGRGYIGERKWHRNNGHKPSWRWQTKNLTEAEEVINLLLPYMGARRTVRMYEALVMIEKKKIRRQQAWTENGRKSRKGQTHCKRGHELAGDNLFVYPNGWRRCRTCHAANERERQARQRVEGQP